MKTTSPPATGLEATGLSQVIFSSWTLDEKLQAKIRFLFFVSVMLFAAFLAFLYLQLQGILNLRWVTLFLPLWTQCLLWLLASGFVFQGVDEPFRGGGESRASVIVHLQMAGTSILFFVPTLAFELLLAMRLDGALTITYLLVVVPLIFGATSVLVFLVSLIILRSRRAAVPGPHRLSPLFFPGASLVLVCCLLFIAFAVLLALRIDQQERRPGPEGPLLSWWVVLGPLFGIALVYLALTVVALVAWWGRPDRRRTLALMAAGNWLSISLVNLALVLADPAEPLLGVFLPAFIGFGLVFTLRAYSSVRDWLRTSPSGPTAPALGPAPPSGDPQQTPPAIGSSEASGPTRATGRVEGGLIDEVDGGLRLPPPPPSAMGAAMLPIAVKTKTDRHLPGAARVSGTTALVPDTTAQVSGTTAQVSGTTAQVSGTTAQVSGTTGSPGSRGSPIPAASAHTSLRAAVTRRRRPLPLRRLQRSSESQSASPGTPRACRPPPSVWL
ncbi:hypothetical protein PAPYR_2609 [Paratrimastix pyriformis]|uniref:Transmembrane protein n=1 Tax=Paratrimastix pyriformis TaxID=342808 RepID=A0ABQ8UST5_9EUKA|nr:hypothetical protein PAPYR_2609 [Paratrimastix pyriformis]